MSGIAATISSPVQPATAAVDPSFSSVQMLLTGDYPVGSRAFNSDGSDNQVLVTPVSTVRADPASPYQNGYFGTTFNGTNQYISTPASSAFNLGSANFTIECWFFGTSFNASGGAMINNGGEPGSASYLIRPGSNGSIQFAAWSGGSTVLVNISAPASTFVFNTWNHLAVTRSGNLWTIWVNGVSTASTTVAGSVGNTGRPFYVATESNGSGTFYASCIVSNLRIVLGTAVYTATFTPQTSPLTPIAGTSFLSLQDRTLTDKSANSIVITAFNSPATNVVPLFTLPQTTGSAFFNGTSDYLSSPNPSMSGTWTVEFWTYPTANTGTSQMMTAFNNAGGASGMNIFRNASNNLAFDDGVSAGVTFTNAALPINTWTHVAIVRNGTTVTGYVNGVSVGSGTFTPLTVNTLYIGRFGGSPLWLNGYLSNLRVVNGTALYISNFTPSIVPLGNVPNTSLLTLQFGVSSTNNKFIDSSPRNYVVTPTGTPYQGTFSPYSSGGGSTYFNGSSVITGASGSATLGSANFTVECWVNVPNVTTVMKFVNNAVAAPGGDTQWQIGMSVTGFPQFIGWSTVFLTSSVAMVANTWNHIAVVRIGTSLTMYLNGVSVATATNSTNFSSTNGCYVGRGGGGGDATTGYISNVRVVTGTAMYTAAFTPPTAPVTATPKTVFLMNSTNAGVFDSSRKNNLQLSGTAQASTTIRLFGSSSLFFDGSNDHLIAEYNSGLAFGTGDFTIDMWVYPFNLNASQQVIFRGSNVGSNTTSSFQINLSTAGVIAASLYNGSTVYTANQGTVTAGTWNYVAVTRIAGSMTVYVNGTGGTVGAANVAPNDAAGFKLYVATDTTLGAHFGGYLEDVRITPGIARYTANFTVPAIATPQQ
jgi:hypothetical protein